MAHASAQRTAVARTGSLHWPHATYVGPARLDEEVAMSIWLRPRADAAVDLKRAASEGAKAPAARRYQDRAQLHHATDCSDDDVASVAQYCTRYGLEPGTRHWRSLEVSGTLGGFVRAFGADVSIYRDETGRHFRSRNGLLECDRDIAHVIAGVFGFSQWPRTRKLGALQRRATPLRKAEVETRYAFPSGTARGQTIGIIQLGGALRADDFARAMRAQHVVREMPIVKHIDTPSPAHAALTEQDLESALDAQIAGALAPHARLVVYHAPDSERSLLNALCAAIFDEEHALNVLSISYGWPEYLWTPAALDIATDLFGVAALAGMSVFCASGDNGAELDYDGKPHVLFPASSPFAMACGATAITAVGSEAPWERSGSGSSAAYHAPAWQRTGPQGGRAVPDFAAQQHPGYFIYLDGVELAAGGTSAVAPTWAALTARLNERIGASAGFFTPLLYARAGRGLHDGKWKPGRGLGVPIGTEIETLLRA